MADYIPGYKEAVTYRNSVRSDHPANPYLTMPVDRVRVDALSGVSLARQAWRQRDPVGAARALGKTVGPEFLHSIGGQNPQSPIEPVRAGFQHPKGSLERNHASGEKRAPTAENRKASGKAEQPGAGNPHEGAEKGHLRPTINRRQPEGGGE